MRLIKAMADILRHRGPDDEGFLAADTLTGRVWPLVSTDSQVSGEYLEEFNASANLFLGHRRLSIIDPTPAGHQPMSNSSENCWIVFNGEIYNYLELRAELKDHYHFRTNTDTEVILAAYQKWGLDCVSHFNGMWAFAIYDLSRNVLFASRDRFGVKPFYYATADGNFAFASEIKALLALPFIDRQVNHAAVFDYLAMSLEEHGTEGFFKGIFELKPAHSLELDLGCGTLRIWKYYDLETVTAWEPFVEAEGERHVRRVRELLFDAVRLRLRSDVSVGSCLSGGLDSSSIVCIINELLKGETLAQVGERQKVFTASYPNKLIDESRWAQAVVEKTQTSWHRTYPEAEDLMSDLEDLVLTQEIPFSSTSIYAQYRVLRLARESGVKVLLDGQGGDELFAGYPTYYRAFFAEMAANRDTTRFVREFQSLVNAPVAGRGVLQSLAKLYLLRHLPRELRLYFQKRVSSEHRYFAEDFWTSHIDRLDIVMGSKAFINLNGMLRHNLTADNLKQLLKYEDRNSMRFSIESRTPFADDINLIDYVFRIPSSYKIRDGWSKWLLRESMAGILPEGIRRRVDKVGFATPELAWLRMASAGLRQYLVNDLDAFVDIKAVRKDWDSILLRQSNAGATNFWKIINLGAWLKTYRLAV